MGAAPAPALGAPARVVRWPGVEWLLVGLTALALSGALVWLGPDDLRGDQQVYNLLVAKLLDPGLLPRDVLYARDPALLHAPWFLRLHAWVSRLTDGDVERALSWLAWPMGALYLAGHYVLFRAASGRPAAAALAALGALTVRNALGGEYWGFDGARAAAARTILAGLTPLLLLAAIHWRRHWSFPGLFLVLGVLFNVHPVSAYQLAAVIALAHLWMARGSPRAIGQVGVGAALFVAATVPYLVSFFAARDDASDRATLALARAALDYRFPYLLYPIAPNALLSVAFHMALPVAAWWWWRRSDASHPLRRALTPLVVAALGVGLVGTAVVQAVGTALDRPYADIQLLRAMRLVYPVFLAGLAVAYARLLARGTWRARTAVGALVLLSLVPPGALIHAFSEEQRAVVKRMLGVAAPAPPPAAAAEDARPALLDWARRSTATEALFLTDDWEFRLRTRRSITGSYKDGALLFLAGNRPFTAWYRLDRDLVACRARRGQGCWFELGARLGADYVIVDPGLSETSAPPSARRVWSDGDWSVWALRPA
jgi:hypothetical protein